MCLRRSMVLVAGHRSMVAVSILSSIHVMSFGGVVQGKIQ